MSKIFQNRTDAGRRLGVELQKYSSELQNPLLLGLPRGGVPIARAAAERTGWEWDIWIVRKVVLPQNREFAVGALAERGDVLWNEAGISEIGADEAALRRAEERSREELRSYRERFRGGRPAPEVGNRDVVIVDDGLATGLTARAVARALRAGGARRVWGAFPVAPGGAPAGEEFDRVVFLAQPKNFHFVGAFYKDFEPPSDESVLRDIASSSLSES